MISTSYLAQSYVSILSPKSSAGESSPKESLKTSQKNFEKKSDIRQTGVTGTERRNAAGSGKNSRIAGKESTVTDFIRRHPESRSRVMEMVQAGRSVRKSWGVEEVDTQSMTMSEYKTYISSLLGKIPFAPTRPYDEETVFISEEGWEQMKNDPEYEAWVLGYTKINRSVEDPFFGMGSAGSFAIEHFGASIDEHNGHGYSKLYGGSAAAARGLFQAESAGGMTCRASKNRDIARQLEKERIEEDRQNKKRRKKKQQEELQELQIQKELQIKQQEYLRFLQQSAYRSAGNGLQIRDVRTNLQTAVNCYEAGLLFET